jgi:hypothetical protein
MWERSGRQPKGFGLSIAGTPLERENCVGRVTAVFVHGIDDNQVPISNGEAARDFYAERNGCSATTVPPMPTCTRRCVRRGSEHADRGMRRL